MNGLELAFYLFSIGSVFILFFVLLTIFGFIIIFIMEKITLMTDSSNPIKGKIREFPEKFLISFGIGLSVYVCLCYIVDLVKMFNFFTVYLPLIIIDIIFVSGLIWLKRNNLNLSSFLFSIKSRMKQFFSDKKNITGLIILFSIIFLNLLFQCIAIFDSSSLIYSDPFKWYQTTFYLIDNGHIEYEHLDYNYPSGHTFFTAGVLLIYPDYIFGYYYFKYISLFLLPLYFILTYIIARRLFTKNYLVLLVLLLLLISRYFIARTMYYLSSSLASGLLIITLLVILKKFPDYYNGILLPGLYIVHNLTAFYFTFALVGFYLFRFLIYIKDKKYIIYLVKSIFITIGILSILLIPYLLSIYIVYNDTFFDFILHFFGRFEEYENSVLYINRELLKNHSKLYTVLPLDWFKNYVPADLLGIFDELFERSIYLFFIFSLLGLFMYIKPRKNRDEFEWLIFLKCSLLIILIFFFLPLFSNSFAFFIKFRKRIMQSFILPIIILAVYSIEGIIEKSKFITEYLAKRFFKYRSLLSENKMFSKYLKVENLLIFLILVSAGSTFYMHRFPDYHYYYDDETIEVLLYLRENAEENSKILRPDLDPNVIFRMLYDMKVKGWSWDENATYSEILSEIFERDIDYLIFSKDYLDNSSIEDTLEDNVAFDNKLENDEYILYKIDF
ncbi:MAG: hypothetical protein GF353_27585 [Candidatus Lokiarchaeota archaeon]|nr:hypothetical protein [Candidatus Lokiarchaeota archaeon]